MSRFLLFLFSLSVSVGAFGASFQNKVGGPPWLHGVGQIKPNGDPNGYDRWVSWMGHEPDIVAVWTASVENWNEFEDGNTGYYFKTTLGFLPKSTPVVLSYPMVPKSISNRNCQNPGMWDQFARGDFDRHYRAWARNFKTIVQSYGRDPANHVIRLGWEMNGDWYPWSVCNKVSEFKASWERAVSILRAEIPGIVIDFSPAREFVGYTTGRNFNGTPGCDLDCFLPAPDSYDVISRSVHDGRPYTTDEDSWRRSNYDPSAYGAKQFGLVDIVAAAKQHNKKIGLTEWGTQMEDCDSNHKKAPNPSLFFNKVHEFLQQNAALVAWDIHFSVSCTELYSRQPTDAAQTYKALWDAGSGGGNLNINTPSGGNGNDSAVPRPPEIISAN